MQELGINLAGKELAFSGYKTVSTESAKSMGVVRTEKGEKPGNSFKFAKDINNFINKVAVERKTGPTVNVFWLKDNAEKDIIFIQVPLVSMGGVKSEIPSLAIALQTDPKTREIIIQLLTAPGATQEALKEYIQALLVPSGTKIETEKINSTKIASLSSSGNALALTSTKRGTISFSDELAKPFKSQIKVDSLDNRKEEVHEVENLQTSTPLMPVMAKKTIPAPKTESTTINEKRQSKEVKTEDENQLQKIDEKVNDRSVLGKFRGEVKIHGNTFADFDFDLRGEKDYMSLPELYSHTQKVYKFDSSFKFAAFTFPFQVRGDIYEGLVPQGFDFKKSLNFVYLKDSQDPNLTKLMITTPNTQVDASNRPTTVCKLFCTIPTSEFNKLKDLIKKYPENAERFIEIAFNGIDNSNAGRKSVKELLLIDLDQYIPGDVAKTENGKPADFFRSMTKAKSKKLLDTNAITLFEFSQPYP